MKKILSATLLCASLGALFLAISMLMPHTETFSTFTRNDAAPVFITGTTTNATTIAKALYDQGYIRSPFSYTAFKVLAFFKGSFESGAYHLSKSMNILDLYQNMANPSMKYVYIPEGWRKEEIADRLATQLKWTDKQKQDFLDLDSTATDPEQDPVSEGIFYPDTYLLPIGDSGEEIGKKMIAAFHENVVMPYQDGPKNVVKLDTILTIASLIQREAGGKSDMPIISGIIWNRLFANWALQIDATLQYAKGNEDKWWPQLTSKDRHIDSPYNTYLNKGLPPTPIANPGEAAIKAALNPKRTNCFFYLHDSDGGFHCTKTYAEHEANIERFYGRGIADNFY